MTRIFIDGDACPVRAEAERVATRHAVRMVVVSNGGLRPSANPLVDHVYVEHGPDVADMWIAGQARAGDVVVTADIPLADACIKAGAGVIQPDGALLTAANIGGRLATRDLMQDLRAADPFRQGGGRPFSKADRARFLQALETAIRAAARPW